MLSSRCWGVLSRSNKKIIHEDEIDNYDMGWSENVEYQIKDVIHGRNGKIRFQTLNIKNPYFYNFRLVPFLNSFGRNLIGELAMSLGISNVLRTMTDSIVCNYDFKSDDQNFIREEKSTGLIIWNGVGKTPNKLA